MPKRSCKEREARHAARHLPEPEVPEAMCLLCGRRLAVRSGYCRCCWAFGLELLDAQQVHERKLAERAALVVCLGTHLELPVRRPQRHTWRTLTGAAVVQMVRAKGRLTATALKDELRDLGYCCGAGAFHDAVSEAEQYGLVVQHHRKKVDVQPRFQPPIIATTYTVEPLP